MPWCELRQFFLFIPSSNYQAQKNKVRELGSSSAVEFSSKKCWSPTSPSPTIDPSLCILFILSIIALSLIATTLHMSLNPQIEKIYWAVDDDFNFGIRWLSSWALKPSIETTFKKADSFFLPQFVCEFLSQHLVQLSFPKVVFFLFAVSAVLKSFYWNIKYCRAIAEQRTF